MSSRRCKTLLAVRSLVAQILADDHIWGRAAAMLRIRERQVESSANDKSNNGGKPTRNRRNAGLAVLVSVAVIGSVAQFGSFPSMAFLVDGIVPRRASDNALSFVAEAAERGRKSTYGLPDKIDPGIVDFRSGNEPAYMFDPDDNDYDELDLSKLNIRKWGCERRNESPFIFVHIGKAGGGSVRARLAASAKDYNRDRWTNYQTDKTYYYPMTETRVVTRKPRKSGLSTNSSDIPQRNSNVVHAIHKGVFVNSRFNNFRPAYPKTNDNFTLEDMEKADKVWKTFEKTLPCNATTPLGQAIACPLARIGRGTSPSCKGRRCDIVYTGHNLLGNELHWLPTEYLARWWYKTPWAVNGDVKKLWQERAQRWHQPDVIPKSNCHYDEKDPMAWYKTHYHDCVAPREDVIDQVAQKKILGDRADQEVVEDWSPLYASLPILRVTVMREPFSWLVSKFFWHQGMHGYMVGIDGQKKKLRTCDNNGTDYQDMAEWVSSAVLKQINHLCGEDCLVRMNAGLMTLDQAERQARHNLQHSFAVVGLLQETQTFYDMVTARAAYMNTSLNPDVEGSRHTTSKREEYARCSKTYQTKEFQENLLAACPELRALQRLYQVGVAVNRAQLQEMQTCGLIPTNSSTTRSSEFES